VNPLIESLRRAVEAAPEDVPLRLHLAGLLLDEGDAAAAIAECGQALVTDPNSAEARALMGRALGGTASSPSQTTSDRPGPGETASPEQPAPQHPTATQPTGEQPNKPPRPTPPASSRPEQPGSQHKDFDWGAAEEEVSDLVEPMFVGDRPPELGADSLDVERPTFGLDQVAGMSSVKDRINASFWPRCAIRRCGVSTARASRAAC
jgi:hypothetical protein